MLQLTIKKNGFDSFQNNIFEISNNHLIEFEKIINDNSLKIRNDDVSVLSEFKDYPNLLEVKKKIFDIFKFNKFDNLEFEDVWIQKNYKDKYIKNELPNIPHIDKIRKIKVMIYLNTITKMNGPIHVYKVDPNDYEKIRLNLKDDYKKRKENAIKDLDKNNFLACVGPIGTSVFFDTNSPHFAGELKDKKGIRKSLRFNFIKKKSFFDELF